MRYCLTLIPHAKTSIAFNYNYSVYKSLVRSLQLESPEFFNHLKQSEFSHLAAGAFRNFNFSVRFSKVLCRQDRIIISDNPIFLYISSPVWDSYIKEIMETKLTGRTFTILESDRLASFTIENVRAIKEPDFVESMKFKLMSPFVISAPKLFGGKVRPYFLRFDDNPVELNRLLTNNLYNKMKAIYPHVEPTGSVEMFWDYEYIDRKLSRGERISKRISITSSKITSKIIGIEAPFKLKGNPELIRIGYRCGFGEKAYLGFGMADTITKPYPKE